MAKQQTSKDGFVRVPFFNSIVSRLLLSFAVPIILLVILGVVSYQKSSTVITDSYKEETLQTIEVLDEYIELITVMEVEEFKSYVGDTTLSLYFSGAMDKAAAVTLKGEYLADFKAKLARDSRISDLFILGDGGTTLFAKGSSPSDDAYSIFMDSAEGEIIMANPGSWIILGSNPELDAAAGLTTGNYAFRYVRKLNNTNALIVIDYSADVLREVLNNLDAGEGGYVAVVTNDGREFYSNAENEINGMFAGRDYFTSILERGEENGSETVTVNGRKYLLSYARIGSGNDVIAALVPQKTMLAKTASIKNLSVIFTIVATLIAVGLAIFISRSLTSTISYIRRKLSKVADGDLTTTLHPTGKDELAELCKSINSTVGNVKRLIEEVNSVSSELGDSAKSMSEAARIFKDVSGEIDGAVGRIDEGTTQLGKNTNNCLGQMDDLSGIITNVTKYTEDIEELTKDTESTIKAGIDSVGGLLGSAEATGEITEEVIVAIRELVEKLEDVHTIVASINGIAKKTNLLSLNASIEAARAGEAGKGFTVVAMQVRELSTQCMDSAGKISDIVKEVTQKANNVELIAGKASDVVSNQNEVVDKTKESFDTINSQVSKLIDSFESICDDIMQMDKSRAKTIESIEGISRITNETISCSEAVNAANEKQSQSISGLDDASEELKTKAEELINMLGNFKV